MNDSSLVLETLTLSQRQLLAAELLQEQVIEQRRKLHRWRMLTDQPAQIDTGYVAQHLVSLITGVRGSGMRGKGEDLVDGSEVKSANFLDALDRRGAKAPRWNFQSNDIASMTGLLIVPKIYLVSFDLSPEKRFRARVWRLSPNEHEAFRNRYVEWMEKLGKPKIKNPGRKYANFQLFPPRLGTRDEFARHGNGKIFSPLRIALDGVVGSSKIFHAEEDELGTVRILKLDAGPASGDGITRLVQAID